MNTLLIKISTSLLLAAITSSAYAQSAIVGVTDLKTRETKSYDAGKAPFSIPITGVSGWSRCNVSQLKESSFQQTRIVRIDAYCVSTNGAIVNTSCVAKKGSIEATIINLLPPDAKIDDLAGNTNASNAKDISLSCNYL